MSDVELRKARLGAGWTQARLARRLGVTQAYVSLMERGKRGISDRVRRRVASVFNLPPTSLPFSVSTTVDPAAVDGQLEQGLARLGYPALAYLAGRTARRNPGALLLMALAVDDLDPRLAAALPWLLLRFDGLNREELVARARSMGLQNRLGFTVSLALRVAERNPVFRERSEGLQRFGQALERSRLAREDTYGRRETSERMRDWLLANRSPDAEHWNLLSDLKPEHLPYAEPSRRTLAQLSSGS
ncbi:MAG: helix-turn-helix transcriptional regulator [Acidobacteriota bacterium]